MVENSYPIENVEDINFGVYNSFINSIPKEGTQ